MSRSWLRFAVLRAIGALIHSTSPSQGPAISGSLIRRLLIVRPDHLGDLLLSTPAICLLRHELPQTSITVLVGPWGKPALERNPHLDQILTWDFPYFSRLPRKWLGEPYVNLIQLAHLLASREFDAALILRFDFWFGSLATALARIPRRVGYATVESRPFLTDAMPYSGLRHEVVRNLDLARTLAPSSASRRDTCKELVFVIDCDDDLRAAALLRSGLRAAQPLIVIHPGAGSSVKLWCAEHFATVADQLTARYGARIALTGTAKEADLARDIALRTDCDPLVLAGDHDLRTLGAIFRHAELVLGVDSGALHLATAVGTPTVHLFGPADDRIFGPYGDVFRHIVVRADVACSPCGNLARCPNRLAPRQCMLEITPEMVTEAADRALMASRSEKVVLANGSVTTKKSQNRHTNSQPPGCRGSDTEANQ